MRFTLCGERTKLEGVFEFICAERKQFCGDALAKFWPTGEFRFISWVFFFIQYSSPLIRTRSKFFMAWMEF